MRGVFFLHINNYMYVYMYIQTLGNPVGVFFISKQSHLICSYDGGLV